MNKTWLIVANQLQQAEARAWCQQKGGELAPADSIAEAQLINTEMLAAGLATYWSGLQARGSVPTTNKANYAWLTTGRASTRDAWGPGEPNNAWGEEGVCVEARSDVHWNDVPCIFAYPFIGQLGEWH